MTRLCGARCWMAGFIRWSGDSARLDLDVLRLGFRGLGQVHRQHAVLELGADLVGTGIVRE
jgi:hypothetical protein